MKANVGAHQNPARLKNLEYAKLSEKDFSGQIEELLDIGGWRWEHPRPARIKIKGTETYRTAISGHKGRPDYLATKNGRLLFIEIKSEKGKLSPEQEEWLADLRLTKAEVYVFKPSQFDEVARLLLGRA